AQARPTGRRARVSPQPAPPRSPHLLRPSPRLRRLRAEPDVPERVQGGLIRWSPAAAGDDTRPPPQWAMTCAPAAAAGEGAPPAATALGSTPGAHPKSATLGLRFF